MSDAIKHECGLAFIRLRKPIHYYHQKYGTAFTGINKLFLLKRFPIHALKNDRTFMTDLPESRESSAIVSAIFTMSRALGLTVVGEGVENSAQARFLNDLGCDLLQGFLFERPAPATAIESLLGLTPRAGTDATVPAQ